MADMHEQELKVFIEAVKHYFAHLTREAAVIRASYLTDAEIPHYHYTGLIAVAGRFRGCVYFSAQRDMLRDLLKALEEPEAGEAILLDAVGEIANTIAGNARRHFGDKLKISVPITICGTSEFIKAAVRARPFVILLRWRKQEAVVVVDLEPTA